MTEESESKTPKLVVVGGRVERDSVMDLNELDETLRPGFPASVAVASEMAKEMQPDVGVRLRWLGERGVRVNLGFVKNHVLRVMLAETGFLPESPTNDEVWVWKRERRVARVHARQVGAPMPESLFAYSGKPGRIDWMYLARERRTVTEEMGLGGTRSLEMFGVPWGKVRMVLLDELKKTLQGTPCPALVWHSEKE
jgi:hypothetical protein